jgi:mannose-6-phosphate isomerase-like protein (cupin superfamily)
MTKFATTPVPEAVDAIAPDGSEIRLLAALPGGSCVHCRLPPGGVSLAVTHRTVEEFWFVLSGSGQVWRKQGGREEIVAARPGLCLTIPLGTDFQFRASPDQALEILIVTTPPWPGNDEAARVADHWPVAPRA